MGVSIHYSHENADATIVPLAGQSEVKTVWMPIVQQKELELFELCLTAGLTLEPEYYTQFLQELSTVEQEIDSKFAFANDPTNPSFRCHRLHEILLNYPPEKGYKIYIG